MILKLRKKRNVKEWILVSLNHYPYPTVEILLGRYTDLRTAKKEMKVYKRTLPMIENMLKR